MAFSLRLVVIDQIDIKGISVFKAKNNSPVAGYRDAPVAFQFPPKRVKPVTRQVKIGRVFCLIKMRQHIPEPLNLIGTNAARIIALKKTFQTLMSKRL